MLCGDCFELAARESAHAFEGCVPQQRALGGSIRVTLDAGDRGVQHRQKTHAATGSRNAIKRELALTLSGQNRYPSHSPATLTASPPDMASTCHAWSAAIATACCSASTRRHEPSSPRTGTTAVSTVGM